MADKVIQVVYWGWAVLEDGERVETLNTDPMDKSEAIQYARMHAKSNRPCTLEIHGQGPNQEIKISMFTGESDRQEKLPVEPDEEPETETKHNFFGRGG
jgi:hypothetical protein